MFPRDLPLKDGKVYVIFRICVYLVDEYSRATALSWQFLSLQMFTFCLKGQHFSILSTMRHVHKKQKENIESFVFVVNQF